MGNQFRGRKSSPFQKTLVGYFEIPLGHLYAEISVRYCQTSFEPELALHDSVRVSVRLADDWLDFDGLLR